KMATLTVTGMPGGTATATLAGAASSLTIDPTSADFGTVAVNGNGGTKSFTVTNRGTSATTALHVSVSTSQFSHTANPCEGSKVDATKTCSVSVTFSPKTG